MDRWAETRVPSLLHPYHGDGRAGGWKPAGVAQQGVNDLAPPECRKTGGGAPERGLGKENQGWLFSESGMRPRK